jgi:hypothetical protein
LPPPVDGVLVRARPADRLPVTVGLECDRNFLARKKKKRLSIIAFVDAGRAAWRRGGHVALCAIPLYTSKEVYQRPCACAGALQRRALPPPRNREIVPPKRLVGRVRCVGPKTVNLHRSLSLSLSLFSMSLSLCLSLVQPVSGEVQIRERGHLLYRHWPRPQKVPVEPQLLRSCQRSTHV